MGAILGLQILVRIPVRVENDDRVGGLQIKTETTGTSRQQEEEIIRVFVVEPLEQVTSVV